jgi:hypothetical protein
MAGMLPGRPTDSRDGRQHRLLVVAVALLVLASGLVGALVPARLVAPVAARLLFGLVSIGLGTLLVRLTAAGAAVVARRLLRARSGAGATAALEARRPPSPIAWLASCLLVVLAVLSLVVWKALTMVDALQGGPTAWLSVAIGAGLAASCLAVAVFVAWLPGQPRRRLAAVLGLVVLAAGAVSSWLAGRGDELVGFPPPEVSRAAGDPGLSGPHAVEVLDYGPADDLRPGHAATPGLLTGRFDLAAVASPDRKSVV